MAHEFIAGNVGNVCCWNFWNVGKEGSALQCVYRQEPSYEKWAQCMGRQEPSEVVCKVSARMNRLSRHECG